MEKYTCISGFCPLQNDDTTIEVRCMRYSVTGAPAYATIIQNMCILRPDCPYGKNCPIENQNLLWDDL